MEEIAVNVVSFPTGFDFWLSIISIVVSVIAIFFSVFHNNAEKKRQVKEATIHAFDLLNSQKEVSFLFSSSKKELSMVEKGSEDWCTITTALYLLEHFAVGVNTGIYDLETLDRMAGNKILCVIGLVTTVIEKKKGQRAGKSSYEELQTMGENLFTLRVNRGRQIPPEYQEIRTPQYLKSATILGYKK